MIINIRGCNGSGKTTVVRELMAQGEFSPIYQGENRRGPILVGYAGTVPKVGSVAIVGKYDNTCGGCDSIKSQDEIVARVRDFHGRANHVVFEGVIVSDCYGRYAALSRELPPMLLAWLNTPLDVCLRRVQNRRVARGDSWDGFNPDLVEQKWNNARRQYAKAVSESVLGDWMPYDRALDWTLGWLGRV